MARWRGALFLWAVVIASSSPTRGRAAEQYLADNFYDETCAGFEGMVSQRMAFLYKRDPNIAPQLIRLMFHDCFVRGCDASVLLDGAGTERAAHPELNLAHLVIDDLKAHVEASCPLTVSCADILVTAARDAIRLAGGPNIPLEMGRHDGVISRVADNKQLPQDNSIQDVLRTFATWKLGINDMVVLTGAHTLGKARCKDIKKRLVPRADPLLNATYAAVLSKHCGLPRAPQPQRGVWMDPITPLRFDNAYFKTILARRGALAVDSGLGADPRTAKFVALYAGNVKLFFRDFSTSFLKLSRLWIPQTEQVRSNCRRVNPPQ